jgi:CarboxypepD_reg-like domain
MMLRIGGLFRLLFFVLLFVQSAFSQVVIKGRVTDAANGDPIPFASVGVMGLNYGTTTNFQGEFTLHAKSISDSLFASNP